MTENMKERIERGIAQFFSRSARTITTLLTAARTTIKNKKTFFIR
jgi:hypothetical protein